MARKPLQAGTLRHMVRLYSLVQDQDSTGDMVRSYPLVATVYADRQPLSSRDLIAAQAMQNETTERFVIRWRSDVDTTWRLGFAGKVYAILGAQADQDSGIEYLTLTCSNLGEETLAAS